MRLYHQETTQSWDSQGASIFLWKSPTWPFKILRITQKNPNCCCDFQDTPINQNDSFSYRTEICQQYLYIPEGPSIENHASSTNKKQPLIQIMYKKGELYCLVFLFSALLFFSVSSGQILCFYDNTAYIFDHFQRAAERKHTAQTEH